MRPRTPLMDFRVPTGVDRRDAKGTDMDLAEGGLPARDTVPEVRPFPDLCAFSHTPLSNQSAFGTWGDVRRGAGVAFDALLMRVWVPTKHSPLLVYRV